MVDVVVVVGVLGMTGVIGVVGVIGVSPEITGRFALAANPSLRAPDKYHIIPKIKVCVAAVASFDCPIFKRTPGVSA